MNNESCWPTSGLRDIDDISGLTTTNMAVGTIAYSAPEQLMGEEIDVVVIGLISCLPQKPSCYFDPRSWGTSRSWPR